MASSSGGGGQSGRTGSRFELLRNYNDDFPEELTSKNNQVKRKRQDTATFQNPSFFSKNQKLSDVLNGPQFVVMKRASSNEELTLASVSPFLVMKVIEHAAGKPKTTKLMRDGSLLIHTTSKKQAQQLYKLKQLSEDISVKVYDHPTLNTTKGTIFCRDILMVSDEEIIEGLQEHHVSDVHRMKRRVGDKLVETGLFVLTFDLCQLPTHVDAGYHRLEVREYIPNPRRCFNCQRYGHGAKHCKQQPGICGKCSEPQHGNNNCTAPVCCPNCKNQHHAWDRRCPVFQKELNIQKIQTTHRITNNEARKKYNETFPRVTTTPNISFSMAVANTSAEESTSFAFTGARAAHRPNTENNTSPSTITKKPSSNEKKEPTSNLTSNIIHAAPISHSIQTNHTLPETPHRNNLTNNETKTTQPTKQHSTQSIVNVEHTLGTNYKHIPSNMSSSETHNFSVNEIDSVSMSDSDT